MNELTQSELEVILKDLEGWELKDDKLTKLFKFKNFREAMTFLMRLAFEAEAMNHHPEIENVYNKVRLSLTTHDAGNKVTEQDVALARQVENLGLPYLKK
jgi:4a-hydroxytetrahydrobiopterin dehydratase